MKKLLDYVFDYIDEIKPERDIDGNIITYNPKERYAKKSAVNLNKYGNLDFCRFSVNNLPANTQKNIITDIKQKGVHQIRYTPFCIIEKKFCRGLYE